MQKIWKILHDQGLIEDISMEDFGAPEAFVPCDILDVYSAIGCYIVTTPSGTQHLAINAQDVSAGVYGARSLKSYIPTTRVLVMFSETIPYGLILCKVPDAFAYQENQIPSIVLRSGGFMDESAHNAAYFSADSTLEDFGCGNPIDLFPGDWGYMNELGLMFFMGRLMLAMKADDMAKIEMFKQDHLVRLVAYNYERFGAALEQWAIDDNGEYSDVTRMTLYPWEALGLRYPGTVPSRDGEGWELDREGVEDFVKEPDQADQAILPRYTKLMGYLGDFSQEYISVPPVPGEEDSGIEQMSKETNHLGILRILKGIDGAYQITSAKEIALIKRILIPVPKEMHLPQDPAGDGASNYSPSQVYGNKQYTAHEKKEYEWSNRGAYERSLLLEEYHAYMNNVYQSYSEISHTKDWYLPEESELLSEWGNSGLSFDGAIKALEPMGFQFYDDYPKSGELLIDHRSGNAVRYFQSESFIRQLDDGSIIIGDGYGAEIKLSGGNIFMTCPGDVWLKPGRSMVTWAPYDAIIKAGNSVDVSASLQDVRIKAERNLQMVGGNAEDREGGVLIESKSIGDINESDYAENGQGVTGHGIALKSADSEIALIGKRVQISAEEKVDVKAGTDITMNALNVLMRLQEALELSINETASSTEAKVLQIKAETAVLAISELLLGGSLKMAPADGQSAELQVNGSIQAQQNIKSLGGNIESAGQVLARGTIGQTAEVDAEGSLSTENFSMLGERVGEKQKEADDNTSENAEEMMSNATKDAVGFSFRSTEEMGLDDTFKLTEERWQKQYKGGDGKAWEERPVVAPAGEETYPHPGKEGWEGDNLVEAPPRENVDDKGVAVSRSSLKSTSAAATPTPLKDGYIVNIQQKENGNG